MIGWIFKLLVVVAMVGAVGLVGYAYLGDLSPNQNRVTEPIVLPLDGGS